MLTIVVLTVPFVALAFSKRDILPLSSYLARTWNDVVSVEAAANVAEPSRQSTETVFAR